MLRHIRKGSVRFEQGHEFSCPGFYGVRNGEAGKINFHAVVKGAVVGHLAKSVVCLESHFADGDAVDTEVGGFVDEFRDTVFPFFRLYAALACTRYRDAVFRVAAGNGAIGILSADIFTGERISGGGQDRPRLAREELIRHVEAVRRHQDILLRRPAVGDCALRACPRRNVDLICLDLVDLVVYVVLHDLDCAFGCPAESYRFVVCVIDGNRAVASRGDCEVVAGDARRVRDQRHGLVHRVFRR